MSESMTVIDREEIEPASMSLIQPGMEMTTAIQLAGALMDKRIVTARQFPRSIARFKNEATNLIREDKELAAKAEYAKPVGGSKVTGASIRLLEIAALCWGNLDDGMVEAVVEDKSVRVTWFAYDLERNLRSEGYSSTSILDKHGKRYPQHLIETTVMATASKARRNALEKVIPKAFIKTLLNTAKEVARGQLGPLPEARKKLLDFFSQKHGVPNAKVYEYLGVKGSEDITEELLDEMRAVANSLKDGEATVEEFFGGNEPKQTAKDKLKGLQDGSTQAQDADKLPGLLIEFDGLKGDLAEFLGRHGYDTPDNLLGTTGEARAKAVTKLAAEVERLKGGAK